MDYITWQGVIKKCDTAYSIAILIENYLINEEDESVTYNIENIMPTLIENLALVKSEIEKIKVTKSIKS